MKIRNSLGFRLFVIFSILMIAFVCILTFLQLFIIGRMYTTSLYVQEREKELNILVPKTINEVVYFIDYQKDTPPEYRTEGIEGFERANNVSLMVFDRNAKIKNITAAARNELKPGYISNISYNIQNNRFRYSSGRPWSFRIYGRFNIPTKYVAVVYPIQYSGSSRDYAVAVIPEVFTASASSILKSYIAYIVLIALLITFGLSAFFSYIVAKPISDMNKSASRMAVMDFSAKCKIERNDEIGYLAATLNYLSSSLESTLKKLYEANDKLKKDLDLQKELDMLRKDFIAAITHELKTPVTLIRGYGESIKDNVADGRDRDFAVDTIINETEKIDKLVNDLLDLSTLEAPGYILNIESFDIGALLEDITKKYKRIMEDRNIIFKTSPGPGNIFVKGDSFRIEQVITNFLNNAIDHTGTEREIILYLEDKGGNVIVSVKNQGEQISEDERNRIWEKFYRIEKSRNKRYGGSGLGLAISAAILKLHGSSYGAENTTDGVKFYFSLEKSRG